MGWGRARKGPRPEIADSDGRETGLRGCGRREGAREEGKKPGRHRPGSLCTGSLRYSAQPPQRPGGPPPPPGPGALADPSADSAIRDADGGGRHTTASASSVGEGGYCEEGRKAHLKFRDICSPREETLGARRLGAPAPPAPSAVPGAGLPHHPPAPHSLTPAATNAGWQGREEGAPNMGSVWG